MLQNQEKDTFRAYFYFVEQKQTDQYFTVKKITDGKQKLDLREN